MFINKLKSPFAIFLYKKLLVFLGVFMFSITLLFILPRLMPSSPVDIMISNLFGTVEGETGLGISEVTAVLESSSTSSVVKVLLKTYLEKFGLDKPIEVQFLLYLKRVFTFDFGYSYAWYPQKVNKIILWALPWTLALITPVPIIGFFLGNRIGSLAVLKKSRAYSFLFYTFLYLSRIPYYWFAMVLIYFFAVTLRWAPAAGAYSSKWLHPVLSFDFLLDAAKHYVLPFLSLVSSGIGGWAMGMRSAVSSQIRATYPMYCKQLGLSFGRIRKYIERNAILPNFTVIPIRFSGLVGQTLLVEVVFGYPGLGSLMYNAAYQLDYPMLEATFLMIILITLIGNLICDIVYGILDPTIGSSYVESA